MESHKSIYKKSISKKSSSNKSNSVQKPAYNIPNPNKKSSLKDIGNALNNLAEDNRNLKIGDLNNIAEKLRNRSATMKSEYKFDDNETEDYINDSNSDMSDITEDYDSSDDSDSIETNDDTLSTLYLKSNHVPAWAVQKLKNKKPVNEETDNSSSDESTEPSADSDSDEEVQPKSNKKDLCKNCSTNKFNPKSKISRSKNIKEKMKSKLKNSKNKNTKEKTRKISPDSETDISFDLDNDSDTVGTTSVNLSKKSFASTRNNKKSQNSKPIESEVTSPKFRSIRSHKTVNSKIGANQQKKD